MSESEDIFLGASEGGNYLPILPSTSSAPVKINSGGIPAGGNPPSTDTYRGATEKDLIALGERTGTPFGKIDSPTSMIPTSELLANQRYPVYQRGVDLENIYAQQQSWYSKLANSGIKFGINAGGTFAQKLSDIPNTISAIRNRDITELAGDPEGYEGTIANFMNNMENKFPNYLSKYERENPWAGAIPFTEGSANWWGENVLKNLGFMAGAVSGAVAEDAVIGAVTGGIGAIPVVGAQLAKLGSKIGQASLYLNKITAGTNKLDEVLDLANSLGKTEQQLDKIKNLAYASQAAKLGSSARLGAAVFGSAMTESKIEGVNGYRTIVEELTNQYKLEHLGQDPTLEEAEKIKNYANDAMNVQFGINMALLTVSNSYFFGNFFKSIIDTKSATQSLGNLTNSIGLKAGSIDVFEKKVSETAVDKIWDVVKPTAKNIFTEGIFEEGGQFAAEKGTYDYYTRKYKNLNNPEYRKSWNELNEVINSTVHGMAEQYGSSEGLMNMVIGGIIGAGVGSVTNRLDKVRGVSEDQKLNTSVNILNRFGVTSILGNKYTDTLNSVNNAKEMQVAADSNNVFAYKNLKYDNFFDYVTSRLGDMDLHDVTIAQLQMLKDLPKDQFEEAFGMNFDSTNKQTVDQYVDQLISEANNIKKINDSINFTFQNPFTFRTSSSKDDPNIDAENANYLTFNEWKKNLTYYASIAPEVARRKDSIQLEISKISPALNNDILSKFTNKEDLMELADYYKKSADLLEKSVTETTSPFDKKDILRKANDYRKVASSIDKGVKGMSKDGVIDVDTFDYALNFELNGQDLTKDRAYPIDKKLDLLTYSNDLSKLDLMKERASEKYDFLASQEGLDKFFSTADIVAQDVDKYEPTSQDIKEILDDLTDENVTAEDLKSAYEDEKIALNSAYFDEYGRISKALKDKPNEKAQNLIDSDTLTELEDAYEKLTAPQKKKYKAFYELAKEKITKDSQTFEDNLRELKKEADLLGADMSDEIDGISKESGIVGVGEQEVDVDEVLADNWNYLSGKAKYAGILFNSTTSETDPDNLDDATPHSRRRIMFFNKYSSLKNKNNIKAILITPNQEEGFGLKNITSLFSPTNIDPKNPDEGPVVAIFVEEYAKDLYYINENGERVGKFREPVDESKLVFATMPTAELERKDGSPRFIVNPEKPDEPLLAAQASENWTKIRHALFKAPITEQPIPYDFSISPGVPIFSKTEKSSLQDTNFATAQDIRDNRELIKIATSSDAIVINNNIIKIKNGSVVLTNNNEWVFAYHKRFSKKDAETIYAVVSQMMNEYFDKVASGEKKVKFNKSLRTFLQNVMYMRSEGETTPSQMYINRRTMELFIGGKRFPLRKLDRYKTEMVDVLQQGFHNVNDFRLKNLFDDKFVEYYLEKNELKSREWDNYQSYLLLSTYPDGSSRPTDSIPMLTRLKKNTENSPNRVQRYAILAPIQAPIAQLPPAQPAAPSPTPTPTEPGATPMSEDGKYELNNTTVYTRELTKGPIDFTIDTDYRVTISSNDNTNATISKYDTPETIAAVKSSLNDWKTQAGLVVAEKQPNQPEAEYNKYLLQIYFSFKQTLDIVNAEKEFLDQQAQQAAPSETKAEESDVEAKEVDIEKRNKILENRDKDRLEKLKSEDLLLAAHFLISRIGLQNEFGSDTSLLTNRLKISFKEAEELVKQRLEAIKPKGWKLGDNYDTSILDKKVNDSLTEIDAKYDKELEALTGKPVETPKTKEEVEAYTIPAPTPAKTENVEAKKVDEDTTPSKPSEPGTPDFGDTPMNEDYRLIGEGEEQQERITGVDIDLFQNWAKEKLPVMPYEFLENILITHDNQQAWGAVEKGVAKIFKKAIRGTEYHEAFHYVFNAFLSPANRQAIFTEFRSNSGTFVDRASGKTILYTEATDEQIEEKLADDFAAYRLGKLPARNLSEFVARFFKAIIGFFKSFVNNTELKDDLFKAIDAGKFKDKKAPKSMEKVSTKYSRRTIPGLTPSEVNGFIQDMIYQVRGILLKDNKSLYNFNNESVNAVFDQIKLNYTKKGPSGRSKLGELEKAGPNTFDMLKERVIENLRSSNIKVSAEDSYDNTEDTANRNDYTADIFDIDVKKASSPAIKLLVGGLVETKESSDANLSLALPKLKENPVVNGATLLNRSRSFATLLSKLSNSSDIYQFLDKLAELAKKDSNYVRLIRSLRGDENTRGKKISFDKLTKYDFRLLIQFFKTFNKQRPDAYVTKMDGGSVYTKSANLSDATNVVKKSWQRNLAELSRVPNSLIRFDRESKTYLVSKRDVDVKDTAAKLQYLNDIGISITPEIFQKFNREQLSRLNTAFLSLYGTLQKKFEIYSLSGDSLSVGGPLNTIAELYAEVTNPLFDNTLIGANGKRKQSFVNNNSVSYLESLFNSVKSLDELKERMPALLDVFSTNSKLLELGGVYFKSDGTRTDTKIKIGYIDGVENVDRNKNTPTSKLNFKDKLINEINQNLSGRYYILNPADGVTEWTMQLKPFVSYDRLTSTDINGANLGINDVVSIFRGYLIDDILLAQQHEERSKLKNIGSKAKELRFFKDILPEKMVKDITKKLVDTNASIDVIKSYLNNKDLSNSIDSYIGQYLDEIISGAIVDLGANGAIFSSRKSKDTEEIFNFSGLINNFVNRKDVNLTKTELTGPELRSIVAFSKMNALIANIEYHKILFGDPLQFEVKTKNKKEILDELKRIKSFLSGSEIATDFSELNTRFNELYNYADANDEIVLSPGDPGYHRFKPYLKTVSVSEVYSASEIANVPGVSSAYENNKEADAQSHMSIMAFRDAKLRNGEWGDAAEEWYRWQMAYTRDRLSKKGIYNYKNNEALRAHDAKLIDTPEPDFKLEVLKPIVRGSTYGSDYINLVLDKTSQFPLYYKAVEGRSLEQVFVKMMLENGADYIIPPSGRKAGVRSTYSLYVNDKNSPDFGKINTAPIPEEAVINVPWGAYGIQVMNQYSDTSQRFGSQLTKNVTVDLYNNGLPQSPRADFLTKQNTLLLKDLKRNGYNMLLKKFGMSDNGISFTAKDKRQISKTLYEEISKRGLDDNLFDTISVNEDGEFIIPFESSSSYTQIRDILYSIVYDTITSPTVSGSANVQVSALGWENAEEGRTLLLKDKNGKWSQISREEFAKLSDEEKSKVVLGSSALNFYTKEDPYCDILLPHWFKNKFNKKRFPTDESIIEYLNNHPKGKEILKGVGFRIPHQSLNATEVFRVKGFLPQALGKSVVVPSEITTKAGSDFDVDKLNMYLKAVYVDANDDVQLIELKGTEEETKTFYASEFDKILQTKQLRANRKLDEALRDLDVLDLLIEEDESGNADEDLKDRILSRNKKLTSLLEEFGDIFEDTSDYISGVANKLRAGVAKLSDVELQANLKEIFVDRMYTRALENAYYENLEKILTLPENFERLVATNEDDLLEKIANRIDDLTGQLDKDNKYKTKVVNPNFISNMRNIFSGSKAWVGIVAQNVTSHSLFQKHLVVASPSKLMNIRDVDARRLGNLSIALPHNSVDGLVTMSSMYDANPDVKKRKLISAGLSAYINAVVDIVKDPYIRTIIRSDKVVNIFMFLQRAGVPREYAALFMNQPIIIEYLKNLDRSNVSGLFNRKEIGVIERRFYVDKGKLAAAEGKIDASLSGLANNIEKYYKPSGEYDMPSDQDKIQQRLIFKEFIKYATFANHLSMYLQALSYDTTKFRSVEELYRKMLMTKRARTQSIFSGIDDILKESFIGDLSTYLSRVNLGLGETNILRLNKPEMQKFYINGVLEPYASNFYMSGDDYRAVSTKVSASFIDYIIQTNLNLDIDGLLNDGDGSIANQLEYAKLNYPTIEILQHLQIRSSKTENGTNTVSLSVNIKDTYDQNLYTGLMRELRDTPDTNELYNNIVKVSILQGTYGSPISIRNIIPVEDYSKLIAPIIEKLFADPKLMNFAALNSFQRNAYRDTTISPKFVPDILPINYIPVDDNDLNEELKTDYTTSRIGITPEGEDIYEVYMPQFESIPELDVYSRSREVLSIDSNTPLADYDLITMDRIAYTGDMYVDLINGVSVPQSEYDSMIARKDPRLKEVVGYQKVKYDDGTLFTLPVSANNWNVYYKRVNLLGDGMYGVEHYAQPAQSVLNNNTFKTNELSNAAIISALTGGVSSAEVVSYDLNTIELNPDASVTFDVEDSGIKPTPTTVEKPTNKLIGKMSFTYGNDKRSDVTATTTFDAILSGERTATTRYESNGNIDYWKKAKVGDIITWESEDGRRVDVEVTKELHPLKGSGKTPEQWSKLEGWSKEYFEIKVRPRIDEAWQMEYKLAKPTQVAKRADQELRDQITKELPSVASEIPSGMMKLKDGNKYEISKIDSKLLASLGYSKKKAGELLKLICKNGNLS